MRPFSANRSSHSSLQNHPQIETAAPAIVRADVASTETPRLPAGVWLRVVMGFQAPFGHDDLPTVLG